jgi:hypothetical protein
MSKRIIASTLMLGCVLLLVLAPVLPMRVQGYYPHNPPNSISLLDVGLCASICIDLSPELTATILVNGSIPLSTLHLFINATDEGITTTANTMTDYALVFKAQPNNPAMPIVDGKTYAITVVATFQDNSTYAAFATVVASSGSGITTTSTFARPMIEGVVDVHNDPPLAWTSEESAGGDPYVQPFIPNLPILTGVDIALDVGSRLNVTVEIRDTPMGPILASSWRWVEPNASTYDLGWFHFSFSPPAIITPGKQYLIMFYGTSSPKENFLLVLVIEKYWHGPYLMNVATNGTLIPYDWQYPADQKTRPALFFRTYGLEKLPVTTTTTEAKPNAVSWFLVAVAVAGFIVLGVYVGAKMRRAHHSMLNSQTNTHQLNRA